MTTINITLGGGGTHAITVDGVRPCDVEETYKRGWVPIPKRLDFVSDLTWRVACDEHTRLSLTYAERQNVATLDEVKTVSVPSETETYHNNGERKTYCVTTVDTVAVACTCPDFHYRRRICKHMVSVGTYDDKGSTIL